MGLEIKNEAFTLTKALIVISAHKKKIAGDDYASCNCSASPMLFIWMSAFSKTPTSFPICFLSRIKCCKP